jgi:hypothetical protein
LSFTLIGAMGAAMLAACNLSNPNPSPPPVGPRPDAPTALVKGAVSSPVFDELKKVFRVVQYDGKQKVTDYNLLILDGDAYTPDALKADALVGEAWRAGIGVLTVDAAEDDKRQGLGGRLGLATKDTSRGFFARSSRDKSGHPSVSVVELPGNPSTVKTTGRSGPVALALVADAQNTTAFIKSVVGRSKGDPAAQSGQARSQDNPIPPGLVLKTYYYSVPVTQLLTGVNKNNDPVKTQTTSIQYNYTFSVYLDNQNNPQGNFQWVAVGIDATGNPTNGTGAFACNGCYSGADGNYNADEYAWFLDQQEVTVKPTDGDTALFTSFGSSPATTNNATQVTTGLTFSVGFDGSSGTGSFQYTNQQTRTILDWKLTNQSAGNLFSWYYRTANPIDADLPYDCQDGTGCQNAFTTLRWPKQPNDISLTQLQLSTQGAWKTSQVVNQWVSFVVTGRHGLADTWCPIDSGAFGCGGTLNQSSRYDLLLNQELKINMASVVPIPIQSITFAPAPAKAGAAVTGIVTLKSPAVEDTDIQISSNSPNATVLPTVTVKQGESSATFQVLTNANGIPAGGSTTATFTAYYAGNYQAQLQIVNNPNLAQIAISPNPVRANHTATATLSLGSPVTQDTDFALTSSSPSAAVPGKATVKQGQTSASFLVAASSSGVPINGTSVATISGAGATSPLTVSFSPKTVSAGSGHACALYYHGGLVCWGDKIPEPDLTLAALASGFDFSCGLNSDGTVACWGLNAFGQATPPAGLANVLGLAAGADTACAVVRGGTVVCWGNDYKGGLKVPAGLSEVAQVAVGAGHACALKFDTTVTCWGSNSSGQLNVPVGLSGVTQVSAGDSHTCALSNNGTVLCWGANDAGRLNIPPGLSGVTQVSAGGASSCGLGSDGTVACWGSNQSGQKNVPAGLSGVAEVSVGGIFAMARKDDGTVVSWGTPPVPPLNLNLNQP